MGLLWLWAVVAGALVATCAGAERGGSSLRGALEALQRRQRGRVHGPVAPPPDYDALYWYLPQPYSDPDYPLEEGPEDLPIEEEQNPKYVFKFQDPKEEQRPLPYYEYRIVNKKNRIEAPTSKKESAFRERSHNADNDRLKDLFSDPEEREDKRNDIQERTDNDAEYAMLLSQLWSKYKHNKHHNNPESAPQGVVKLYKEKIVKKRYSDNWGPIAFKRKRSSGPETNHAVIPEYDRKPINANYNDYQPDSDDDLREEYAIAFQPLDDDSFQDLNDNEQYAYETVEKRFPITKRSSGSFDYGKKIQKKRSTQEQKKRDTSRKYRSSSGTDPKLLKDLSKIFGEPDAETLKNPVKRSSNNEGPSHDDYKPPQVVALSHNESHHDHNHSKAIEDGSHEQHGHIHHPGMFGKESDHPLEHGHEHEHETAKPITVKKKSIDWSDYFGIDKRKKKSNTFINDLNQDKLRKQYFDTFNKEVIYPISSNSENSKVKRNYEQENSNEETEIQIENAHALAIRTDDQSQLPTEDTSTKLENIDKKLKNMEGLIVDDALNYSNVGEVLDSKEEQEMKEKLLSKLAAAYSLEKMRKALKEFKQSLEIHKSENSALQSSPVPLEEAKTKRVAVKKEKVIPEFDNEIPMFRKEEDKSEDFEDEQGAGHYLNGQVDEQFSEGYMGGSGRHKIPLAPTPVATGSCPVLGKIVQRCRGVDMLAGDRGQLFLPLCSLHQICYLCGEAPPTTCDLVFLSEADTACEGNMSCQRAARSALMTLRDLHDNLADELDGECEASPCLPATLKLNLNWQRALQR